MKKQLFIVLLLHCSFLSMSQDAIVPDFAFCELIGRKKDFSMQTSVSIDFGQIRTSCKTIGFGMKKQEN
ncbi:MAG: hypothetical protein IPJ43_15340 [Saprospiraceae bacterium]|nr:hypothetical protein [Saprospiraceae bacterium]